MHCPNACAMYTRQRLETFDPATKRIYYYNPTTGETSWTHPSEQAAADSGSTEHHTVSQSTSADVPAIAPFLPGENDTEKPQVMEKQSLPKKRLPQRSAPAEPSGPPQSRPSFAAGIPAAPSLPTRPSIVSQKSATSAAAPRQKGANKLPKLLQSDIKNFQLQDFAERYFERRRKGLFGKKSEVSDLSTLLTWSKHQLKDPLTQMRYKFHDLALDIHHSVLVYTGEKKDSIDKLAHTKSILRRGLAAKELRDEIYCQVCRQVNGNPDSSALHKGWKLICLIASTFTPSRELLPLVTRFIEDHTKYDDDVGEAASFALRRLRALDDAPDRNEIPGDSEIAAIEERTVTVVRIYFPDDSFKSIPLDTSVTAEATVKKILSKLSSRADPAMFAIFARENDGWRSLAAHDRLVDVQAKWDAVLHRHREKSRLARKKEESEPVLRFVLRRIINARVEDLTSNFTLAHFSFSQAVSDVLAGRYIIREDDIPKLASLQLQAKYGDFNEQTLADGHFVMHAAHYMPAPVLDKAGTDDLAALESATYALHKRLAGLEPIQAYIGYLLHLRNIAVGKFFGSEFVDVEQHQFAEMPRQVRLAINDQGMHIFDPRERVHIVSYDFQHLFSWAYTTTTATIIVGSADQQSKMTFVTTEGKLVYTLLQSYVQLIMQRIDQGSTQQTNDI